MHLRSSDRHLLTKTHKAYELAVSSRQGGNCCLAIQRRVRSMKRIKYTAILSMIALLSTVSALARDRSQHSVEISDSVQVGATQLKPGNYKLEWQGTGPEVQVNFVLDGKTIVTAPGTLKTNDPHVTEDDIVTDTTSANTKTLKEIDFSHNKESLVFEQSGM